MSARALQGRRALVTGAARRTGRALALALAEAGADVAVHYRTSEDEALAVAAEIEAMGRRAVAVCADLAHAEQAERAVEEARSVLGPIDTLVNNVGAIVWKNLDEITPADWQTSLDGTLTATYHACRAALPGMRTAGFGRIVNILDADADSVPWLWDTFIGWDINAGFDGQHHTRFEVAPGVAYAIFSNVMHVDSEPMTGAVDKEFSIGRFLNKTVNTALEQFEILKA